MTRFEHILVLAAVLVMVTAPAPAQDMTWNTVDGGGGTSVADTLVLTCTIGQPDAGFMSSGDLTLVGGFWANAGAIPCPADVSGDAQVGFADILQVLTAWGPCPGCPEDIDGDDMVGFSDLLQILSQWGPC